MVVPFSQSSFWQWQREYFEMRQVDAWRQGDVPHYISSNPAMSETYVQLILAFFRDHLAKHEPTESFYFVELGAGSGRFSYHLLKGLDRWKESPVLSQISFKYVITDFVEGNLEFWRQHPRLQTYLNQGILDLALFDAEKDDRLYLENSQEMLSPGQVTHPIVVIGNYFFDSLPQDLYHFQQGQVEEVRVKADESEVPENATPQDRLKYVKLEYAYYPITEEEQNERLDPLLSHYAQNLNESHALIPTIGLRCMERLQALSRQGLFLISADKAAIRLADWEGRVQPFIARHGSISITANYHAFRWHCEQQAGVGFLPRNQPTHITIGAFLYIPEAATYLETRLAYEKHVQDFGPDDYYILKTHLNETTESLSIPAFFGSLRLNGYDSRLFYQLLPRVYQLKEDFTESDRLSFLQLVARVWDGYYPLGEGKDLAFDIALILLELHFPKEALSFLNLSEGIYGPDEKLRRPKAICLHLIGNND